MDWKSLIIVAEKKKNTAGSLSSWQASMNTKQEERADGLTKTEGKSLNSQCRLEPQAETTKMILFAEKQGK